MRKATQRFTRTFAAGRAPACWQKDIASETRRLKRMLELCAWADEPLGDPPALLKEPPFGHCLKEVTTPGPAETPATAQPARRAGTTAPRRADAPVSHARPEPRSAGTRQAGRPSASEVPPALRPAPRQPAGMIAEPGLNVEHVLRLPAEASVDVLHAQASGQRTSPALHAARRAAPPQKPRPRQDSAVPSPEFSQRHQQQALHERVLNRLARSVADTSGQAYIPDASAWQAGWDMPFAEHDMPAGLLDGLVSPPARAEAMTTRRTSGAQPESPQERARRMTEPVMSPAALTELQSSPADSGQPGLPLGQALNRLEETLGHTAGTSGVETREAPDPGATLPVTPAMTPTPMLTPPRVDLPVPAVATAMVWRGAQIEGLSDDDMQRIAALMKRILDDDARRHGIDV